MENDIVIETSHSPSKRPIIAPNSHPIDDGGYTIPSNAINKLYDRVKKSIENRVPGTLIHGRPRLGKTRAIEYLADTLPLDFPKLRIYKILSREHTKPNEDVFFTELLRDVGHGIAYSGKATVKRERLNSYLVERAKLAGQKRSVFFIDDAQLLHESHYKWLMDISNELDRNRISLTVFLIGQDELLNQRSVFFEEEKSQIIGRFMVEPYKFHGARAIDDIRECLLCFDEDSIYPTDSGWSFTKFFFPIAFENNFRLSHSAEKLYDVFVQLRQEAGLRGIFEIPMQYLIRTVEYALKKFGCEGDNLFDLSHLNWKEAISNSGFIEAELYQGKIE
ncbi:hypothetical protein QD46_07790 [Paenibacillus polymyxa]|uniref:ATP-binding protein n=1 Tax=Paenibacillus polymyxa TaxID=1406 RepID=UPI0005CF6F5F|nr:ATP-binding protein [Paenibacillus polymyxa]KJD40540.1 hypothetical protein QD46_07790 [Paenibacillus polymyxa]